MVPEVSDDELRSCKEHTGALLVWSLTCNRYAVCTGWIGRTTLQKHGLSGETDIVDEVTGAPLWATTQRLHICREVPCRYRYDNRVIPYAMHCRVVELLPAPPTFGIALASSSTPAAGALPLAGDAVSDCSSRSSTDSSITPPPSEMVDSAHAGAANESEELEVAGEADRSTELAGAASLSKEVARETVDGMALARAVKELAEPPSGEETEVGLHAAVLVQPEVPIAVRSGFGSLGYNRGLACFLACVCIGTSSWHGLAAYYRCPCGRSLAASRLRAP